MGFRNYKKITSYALYDAGNSNYATLIPSIAFPIYFKTVLASHLSSGDAIWGGMVMLSTLLAAVLGPRIGQLADRRGLGQVMLRWTSWAAIAGTAGLYFLRSQHVIASVLLFIAVNTLFLLATLLYDATLAKVSSARNAGLISSVAWAVGYLGGLVGLLLSLSIHGSEAGRLQAIFLISAGLFLILSLPLVLTRRERLENSRQCQCQHNNLSTLSLWRAFMKDRTRARIFWSYFLYSNGISAMLYFTSLYATGTLGYTLDQLLWLFVCMSIVAVPSVLVFGKLAERLGHVKTLKIIIAGWIMIVGAVVLAGGTAFAVIACVAAALLGPAQALSRSLFRIIFPTESMSSFFGVQSLAARSSALVGPVLFGLVSSATGSQRIGVLTTALLLAAGLAFLAFVPTMSARNGEVIT